MKIKILTFHCAKNYGAILQAYALFCTMKRYSYDVSFINYRPSYLLKLSHIHDNSLIKRSLSYIRYQIRIIFAGNGIKWKKFENFERNYLSINLGNQKTQNDIFPKIMADVVVLGSDQIWNNRITYGDTVYWGDFPKRSNCRLISYAASIGIDTPTEDELSVIRQNIASIENVSVREESAKRILRQFTDQRIEVVLDPVFLLDSTQWRQLIINIQLKQKYLLIYNINASKLVSDIAEVLAFLKGLTIIEILPDGRSLRKIYKHTIFEKAGPSEFVTLFAHAEYVVTSSFHGTAFSLIFNKQFVTVAHPTTGSRQRDLLARIGLSDRIVSSVDDLPTTDVDYSIINERLDIERRKSLDFLERALGVKEE